MTEHVDCIFEEYFEYAFDGQTIDFKIVIARFGSLSDDTCICVIYDSNNNFYSNYATINLINIESFINSIRQSIIELKMIFVAASVEPYPVFNLRIRGLSSPNFINIQPSSQSSYPMYQTLHKLYRMTNYPPKRQNYQASILK